MQVFDTVIKTEYDTCVALGFFDGVHTGHKAVLNSCLQHKKDNEKAVVLTFKQSPSSVVSKQKPGLLTTNEEKIALLEKMGFDAVFMLDFESVMDLDAQQFVADILATKLNAKTVVTGFNYHFGKGGGADADTLKLLCNTHNIDAIKCPPVMYQNDVISSSRIRKCIKNGDIENANKMLSYDFSINAAISSGNHIGTKLNSPTINQVLDNSLVAPKFGVYATKVTVNDKTYIGATNVGTHPTVCECAPVCETHLLDYNGCEIKADKIKTSLLHFVRAEQKFSSLDDLKAQIEKDKKTIKDYFNK